MSVRSVKCWLYLLNVGCVVGDYFGCVVGEYVGCVIGDYVGCVVDDYVCWLCCW